MKHNNITGEVDGTTEEIVNFYKDMGFNTSDLFQKKKKWYCLTPTLLALIVAAIIIFIDQEKVGENIYTVGVIILLALMIWSCATVQHYFKQWITTCIVVVGCVVILLLATKQINLRTISQFSQSAAENYLSGDGKKENK